MFMLCPNANSSRVSVAETDEPPRQPRIGTTKCSICSCFLRTMLKSLPSATAPNGLVPIGCQERLCRCTVWVGRRPQRVTRSCRLQRQPRCGWKAAKRLVQDGPVAATQGAAGRLCRDRCTGPRCSALLGGALPCSVPRRCGSAPCAGNCPPNAEWWTAAFTNRVGGRRKMRPAPPMAASSPISPGSGGMWRQPKTPWPRLLAGHSTSGLFRACQRIPMPG